MMTDEQLHRICVKPELPEEHLGTLPETYQWAGVLRGGRRHMAVAAQVMGLEFSPGAIFTGPEGNGRHTTAYALAKTLCSDRDGYRSLISIHGDDVDFEDREDVYALVDRVTKVARATTALVLILDQPGLSKHNLLLQRLLVRSQKALLREKLRLYIIVIADTPQEVGGEIMSRFPRYHCACPDETAVKKWVKSILQEPVPIKIQEISPSELAVAVQGLSWKQLKDLHSHLLRLMVLQYALKKKSFDAKGITEEQVYREGRVTLEKAAVRMILDSTAAQRQAVASEGVYFGTPVMQRISPYGDLDLTPSGIPEAEQIPETMEISEFTRLVQSMHQLTIDDDGSLKIPLEG